MHSVCHQVGNPFVLMVMRPTAFCFSAKVLLGLVQGSGLAATAVVRQPSNPPAGLMAGQRQQSTLGALDVIAAIPCISLATV